MSHREKMAENTQQKTSSFHADGATSLRGRITPGPWQHTVAGPNHWINARDGRPIAFIGGKDTIFTNHKGTPHKANALLISKAPAMYEALKSITDILRKRLDHLGPLPHTNDRELAEVEDLLGIIEPLANSALE